MLKWFARIAYELAIHSSGLASASGMHQPEEPGKLREAVNKRKAMKRVSK